MKKLRIAFMGTPDFAVPSLKAIVEAGHQVVGVVSQPDRPRGRGQKHQPTPVKKAARELGIDTIYQPEKLKEPDFLESLKALEADLFVVVAFRILPAVILDMPRHGVINLHPSKLPKYRGAAPLHWTILNGDRDTAISVIFLKKEIDAGNIILQEDHPVFENDTTGDLHDRFSIEGARLLLKSIALIAEGEAKASKQDDSLATPAPKITKGDCLLNFDLPASQVRNRIMGLSPFPGAFTHWQGQTLKLFRAQVFSEDSRMEKPGTIIENKAGEIWIACDPGIISVSELQLQGRKRLSHQDFLRGIKLVPGDILG